MRRVLRAHKEFYSEPP